MNRLVTFEAINAQGQWQRLGDGVAADDIAVFTAASETIPIHTVRIGHHQIRRWYGEPLVMRPGERLSTWYPHGGADK